MKNKSLKVLLLIFSFLSLFTFNKTIFFPFVLERLFAFELEKDKSIHSIFDEKQSLRISDTYHKLIYLFENKRLDKVSAEIHLDDYNLFLFREMDNINEKKKQAQFNTWVFFTRYEFIESIELILNSGLTALDLMYLMKYKLGIPFFIKDELNILWDLYFNKKVYSETLFKKQKGPEISFRLNKSKYRDMNKKYLLLIADLAEREMFNFTITISNEAPSDFREFAKALSSNSEYLSYKDILN